MSTITTNSTSGLRPGDMISMVIWVPDKRRWPRFVAWVLRRPAPHVHQTRYFRVAEVVSSTSVQAEAL